MSKEPESKDAEGRRRRRKGGGLRVPSDKVPRKGDTDPGIMAPVPEGQGLAASVSESFGVVASPEAGELSAESAGAGNGQVAAATPAPRGRADSVDEEMPTLVSEHRSPMRIDTKAEEIAASDGVDEIAAEELPTLDSSAVQTAPPTIESTSDEELDDQDAVDIPIDDSESMDVEAAMSIDIDALVEDTGEVEQLDEIGSVEESVDLPSAVSANSAEEESGESVDIPFDDEGTINADLEEESAASAEPEEGSGAGASKPRKKKRFVRARTMALNESDLEEVRAGTDGAAPEAASSEPKAVSPAAVAAQAVPAETAPQESGEVIGEEMLEEISETEAAKEEPPRKRAQTADPPPPPAASAKSAAAPKKPSAPTPAPPPPAAAKANKKPPPAPAPGAEAAKKGRKATPWFDEIFDEDYLRTLPFLTPQATQFEANFVMESLGVEPGAQVLDVGCGYGRHAMELAARGYHVVGLDSSLPLLLRGADEAQRRGLTINFVHGDMREMTFENQFDGAYCLFSSFGYFDDETNKKTAQNIARALKPGARLVVEVLNRDYLVADLPSRVWWEGDGCVVLEEVEFNYFSSRIVSNRSVVFDDGRQLEQEISLRSFSLHELGKFLHAVGFRVLEISGSMSTRGRFFGAHSRDIVVVAERRATKADETAS